MNTTEAEMPEVDPEIPTNAVSVYGQNDALEDFPVLKAFQQYIDAEQAKSRKRLLVLCIFFGLLMLVVIGVFVSLLVNASARNQTLNDRLVEYAMKERERAAATAPVVVQQPQPDNSAIIEKMEAKLESWQRKLSEEQAKSEKTVRETAERARETSERARKEVEQARKEAEQARREAEQARREKDEAERARKVAEQEAVEAAKPKPPSPAEQEVERLKALLASEKKRQAEEAQRRREAELEEYRRKHYPELYAPKQVQRNKQNRNKLTQQVIDELFDEEDEALDDESEGDRDGAIDYFKDASEDDASEAPKREKKTKKKSAREADKEADAVPPRTPSPEKKYSIPVEVRGSSIDWNIPD